MDLIEKIIFLNKLFRNVGEFDARVFRAGEMGFEAIFFNFKAFKLSSETRDDTVGNQFVHLEGDSFGIEFFRVDDTIDPNGDSHAVFVLLVGFLVCRQPWCR